MLLYFNKWPRDIAKFCLWSWNTVWIKVHILRISNSANTVIPTFSSCESRHLGLEKPKSRHTVIPNVHSLLLIYFNLSGRSKLWTEFKFNSVNQLFLSFVSLKKHLTSVLILGLVQKLHIIGPLLVCMSKSDDIFWIFKIRDICLELLKGGLMYVKNSEYQRFLN